MLRMPNGETIRQYCDRTGNSYQRVWRRMTISKWSLKDSLELSPMCHRPRLYVKDTPLIYACKDAGVDYTSVLSRHKDKGETYEEAIKHLKERKECKKILRY